MRKRDLISLINCSKLVERSLFAIRNKIYRFVLNMACEGMIFIKKFKF